MFTEDAFASMTPMAPDAIFALANRAVQADGPKANLVIGAYRDENGKPYPLRSVRKAEQHVIDAQFDHEYLPMRGKPSFIDLSLRMVLGHAYDSTRTAGAQTLSGTGAVSLGAHLLAKVRDVESTPVFFSDPTWPNHYALFKQAGWQQLKSYRYYNDQTRGLDFEGMKEDIRKAPAGSVFVLHQCAHNPTGVDPTHAQWDELADLFVQTQHQVFFDSAYQGYASGNLDSDAYAIRAFVKKGLQIMVAQSYSKNMGLYGERVGCLGVVLKDPSLVKVVESNMETIIRGFYSSPPAYGARIVEAILESPDLRQDWEAELELMSGRIRRMRELVYNELKRLGTPGTWEHVINQIGMFTFLGLSKEQCEFCQNHNVFITLSGRANMAGLTEDTALLLARVVDRAVTNANK